MVELFTRACQISLTNHFPFIVDPEASPLFPPRVPRSFRIPRSQRNGWCIKSPARFDVPTT